VIHTCKFIATMYSVLVLISGPLYVALVFRPPLLFKSTAWLQEGAIPPSLRKP